MPIYKLQAIQNGKKDSRKKMGIDLTSKLNNFDMRLIDTQNVNETSNRIFVNAQSKSIDMSNFDLSKFKRVDLGLEVYTRQINAEKATQIAVRQSGLDINLTQNFASNVKYLNTQAAISRNNDMSKNLMTGKVHTQVNSTETDNSREVFALPKSGNIFDIASLNKDKQGSDGTAYFKQNTKGEGQESKEDSTSLSIFA